MSDNKPTVNLPGELIDEKTFYTLSGASAGVLLVCWAINYVTVDVSWLNYKSYRLIGLLLSEIFAIVIVLQKKDRKTVKWLFTFLNGLLIFVNASGLNIMTSSYIFNPSDTTHNKKSGYFPQEQLLKNTTRQAGIFSLPRMISWWPDEKLAEQNTLLVKQNNKLDSENYQLRLLLKDSTQQVRARVGESIQPSVPNLNDSLLQVQAYLESQLREKQKQIDSYAAMINKTGSDLEQKLAACQKEKNDLYRDSVQLYASRYYACRQSNSNLAERYKAELEKQRSLLNEQLRNCGNEKGDLQAANDRLKAEINVLDQKLKQCLGQKPPVQPSLTLTELMVQVCGKQNTRTVTRPGTRVSDDILLRQQAFYTSMNWNAFCKNFNYWLSTKNTVIK